MRLPVDENGEISSDVPYQALTIELMERVRLLLGKRSHQEVLAVMRELGEDSRCEDVSIGMAQS